MTEYKQSLNEHLMRHPEAEKCFRLFLAALPASARRAQCNPFYRRSLTWDADRCVHCGGGATHFDHIPALTICPEYPVSHWFLYPACKRCNTRKRDERELAEKFRPKDSEGSAQPSASSL